MTNTNIGGDIVENERAVHSRAIEKFANLGTFLKTSGMGLSGMIGWACCSQRKFLKSFSHSRILRMTATIGSS